MDSTFFASSFEQPSVHLIIFNSLRIFQSVTFVNTNSVSPDRDGHLVFSAFLDDRSSQSPLSAVFEADRHLWAAAS